MINICDFFQGIKLHMLNIYKATDILKVEKAYTVHVQK